MSRCVRAVSLCRKVGGGRCGCGDGDGGGGEVCEGRSGGREDVGEMGVYVRGKSICGGGWGKGGGVHGREGESVCVG